MNYDIMTEQEINDICKKYNIENYTINSDGSIDVNDDVLLHDLYLKEIPLKFNKVSGHFDCSDNELTSLKNCPIEVGEYFNCNNNMLTSLEYSPDYVRYDFICNYNRFTSLKYLSKNIGNEIQCYSNPLESLDGLTTSYNKLFCDGKDKLVRKHKLKQSINL